MEFLDETVWPKKVIVSEKSNDWPVSWKENNEGNLKFGNPSTYYYNLKV